MRFYIFSSGSKGNATLIIDKDVKILIDLGVTRSYLNNHLRDLNLSYCDLDFVLLTHEHSDHTKGLDYFDGVNIYCGKNVYKDEYANEIKPYIPFKYKHLTILPIQTCHDVICPLGFIISSEKEKLVYVTDTGYMNEKNLDLCKDATYYIFESNHDKKMLLKTKRPKSLKERILSDYGHMSNDDSALYLSYMIGKNTKEIYLAHISEEANTYELALKTCISILKKKKVDISNIKIETTRQLGEVRGGYEN